MSKSGSRRRAGERKHGRTRQRSFPAVKVAALGALSVAGIGAAVLLYSHFSPRTVVSYPTFEGVREGRFSPEDYISYLNENMPEVLEAKKQGIIFGVYYNPSESELERLAARFVEGAGTSPSSQDFSEHVYSVANLFYQSKNRRGHNASTPFVLITSGQGNSTFVTVWPSFFTDEFNVTDKDAREVVLHEIGHGKNYYDGLNVTADAVRLGIVSVGFLPVLDELKAYGSNVAHIVQAPASFSPDFTYLFVNKMFLNRDSLCPSNVVEFSVAVDAVNSLPSLVRQGSDITASMGSASVTVEYGLNNEPPCPWEGVVARYASPPVK